MVMNPPYGERISSPNLLGLYRSIGEKLKHQFVGNDAWVISYREEAFEKIGLRPSLRIPLFNGALECEFRKYQTFDGKFKEFRTEGGEIKSDEDRRRMREKRPLPRHFVRREETDNDDEIPSRSRNLLQFTSTVGSAMGPKVINTAVSRAKKRLVLVCD